MDYIQKIFVTPLYIYCSRLLYYIILLEERIHTTKKGEGKKDVVFTGIAYQ